MIIWEFHIRKGTWEKKVYIFFQHENINDIVFRGYENPERDEMIQVLEMIIEKTQEQLG